LDYFVWEITWRNHKEGTERTERPQYPYSTLIEDLNKGKIEAVKIPVVCRYYSYCLYYDWLKSRLPPSQKKGQQNHREPGIVTFDSLFDDEQQKEKVIRMLKAEKIIDNTETWQKSLNIIHALLNVLERERVVSFSSMSEAGRAIAKRFNTEIQDRTTRTPGAKNDSWERIFEQYFAEK